MSAESRDDWMIRINGIGQYSIVNLEGYAI